MHRKHAQPSWRANGSGLSPNRRASRQRDDGMRHASPIAPSRPRSCARVLAPAPLTSSPTCSTHPWQVKALTKEAADQCKAAEAATAAATLARRQLAQAQRRLRQAQERAQVEAEAQARSRHTHTDTGTQIQTPAHSRLAAVAATAPSRQPRPRQPRPRQPRQPPQQQPAQPQRGVCTLFQSLATVLAEGNVFADGGCGDVEDPLPPLPEDFGCDSGEEFDAHWQRFVLHDSDEIPW